MFIELSLYASLVLTILWLRSDYSLSTLQQRSYDQPHFAHGESAS